MIAPSPLQAEASALALSMGWVEHGTLIVLAEAASVGLPEAVSVPAAAFDPFLRGAIKRRAANAIARAEALTPRREGDHVIRLAFLLVHPSGPKDLDASDERGVSEAFERLAAPLAPHLERTRERRAAAYREVAADRAPDAPTEPARKRPRRFWPVTTPLVGALVTGLATAAVVVAIPYWTPSPVDRFRKTPFGTALDAPLTEAVAGARSGSVEGHAALLSEGVKRQIGAPAHAELERLLEALPVATESTAPVDQAMLPVFASLNGLNGRLHEAHVPALLHGYARGYAGERSVWITSYFVERREELTFDGEVRKTTWGRRLDTLNLADSSVYKANAEDTVVVSLDVLEKAFVEALLPALAREDAIDPSAPATLQRTAERIVARELREVTHVSTSDAEELSGAIARRNRALEKAGHKPQQNIDLTPGERAGLGDDTGALRTLDAQMHLHRRKVLPAIFALTELVEEAFVARVHDEERFRSTIFPKLGPSDASPGTRARVSSDLGAIARSPSPHLALWMVARKVLHAESGYERGTAETTLRLLLRELGSLPSTPTRGSLTEEALTKALESAFAVDAPKLRSVAAAAYESAFVAPPPPFVRRLL